MNALILMVTHYMYSRDAARVTTAPNDGAPVIAESFYATRIDPPKGGSMILVTMYVCMYVCMYLLNCT